MIKNKIHIVIALIILAGLLFISCEKEVYTEPVEVGQHYENGKVFITSNPTAAQIYVNEKNSGLVTPDTVKWLSTGSYKIRLKLNLFKDTLLTISAGDKTVTKVFVDYTLNPGHYGKIYCTSAPNNVNIFLNGKNTNKQTPSYLTSLFPGEYSIMYQKNGVRADSMRIVVRGGVTSYVSLALEDTSSWVTYNTKNSKVSSNLISSIVVDKNNMKWMGSRDNGIISFDGINFKSYRESNSPLVSDLINCLTFDSQDNLWIGTSSGLMVKKGESWIDLSPSLPSKSITSFAFDSKGNTWIGTDRGLVKFNGNSFTVFNTSNSGINGNTVTGVAVDKAENIWVSSDYNGICKFNGTSWQNYTMANMKLAYNLGNAIRTIATDQDGNIWASHIPNPKQGELGGFTKFDGTNWSQVSLLGLPEQSVYTIYNDKNNNKWVGTDEGIGKFLQPASLVRFNSSNSDILLREVTALMIDAKGDLYVGTLGGGFAKFKRGNF
jgi:hypothetical protein